jgi:hypothetical protein
VTEERNGDAVAGLLAEVRSAGTFEDGARALLKRLLGRASEALEQSAYKGQGRIARGMVHLRPDGEYRALAVLEWGEGSGAGTAPASLLPSTTAWRWVSSSGRPVAVDVVLGQVQALGGTAQVSQDPSLAGDMGKMSESRGRLLGREATHVCALPLRGVRGAVEGMVSLEAECKAALGRPFVWDAALADLQFYCDAAAALGLEGARQESGVVGLMERAAAAMVARARQGSEVDMDLADAFKGLLLAAAVDAAGGRDEAFKALGREALVRNRNHHKVLKRELERVEALCRALGEPVPAAVVALLAQGEK